MESRPLCKPAGRLASPLHTLYFPPALSHEPPPPTAIRRFNVLGVALSAMNLRIATDTVLAALHAQRKGYVCVTGVHGVTEAQDDPAFRRILNAAFLNTTDGMPLVWWAATPPAPSSIASMGRI